jgi:hypothetical protein
MPKYEYKVTASWWITVEADSKSEAEQIAIDTYDDGAYDGVERAQFMGMVEEEE